MATEHTESRSKISQRARMAGGQPISQLMAKALMNPTLISLAAGFVDPASLPVDTAQAAIADVMSQRDSAEAALQYGTTPGHLPLREAILARELAADNQAAARNDISSDQVLITAGSNQLLHLILETLCDPGDIVLCTAPTYLVVLGTMANLGVRAISVSTDDQGIVPAALKETLARLDAANELPRVKAIYLVTYFDNPRGVTLAAHRRQQVLDVARYWSRQGAIRVIEDAAYRELRYDGDDVASILGLDEDGSTVILAGTFSKSFSPGIRVGWGILPADLIGPVLDQKGNIDFGSPNFNQHVMHQVLATDAYDAHIESLRHAYRAKRDAMLAAAEKVLAPMDGVRWGKPCGGLYIWVELPEHIDTGPQGQLFNVALEEGVLYVPGEFFFPSEGEPRQTNCLRLSFGVQTPAGITAGMRALGRALLTCS